MIRLFCFSYAGGTASDVFAAWPGELGPDVEVVAVDVPGRGTRRAETPARTAAALAQDAADVVRSRIDDGVPWALFGHSLGARTAFDVACLLTADDVPEPPAVVIVSGRRPPGEGQPSALADLLGAGGGDEALLEAVSTWGGIPEEFRSHPHLLPRLLPDLRADLELGAGPRIGDVERADVERADADAPPLGCSLVVLGGSDDPLVDPARLHRWASVTTGPTRIELVAGDHFFFRDPASGVLPLLARVLAEAAAFPHTPLSDISRKAQP